MISYPSRHCTVELQALPSRIGQVRRIVSAQLRYWHLDPLIDRATLGVTELLTNVHQHAEPDKTCTVEIELLPSQLVVSVRDRDPRLPVLDTDQQTDTDATCGRGLAMVAAVSESWGARPEGEDGKVVWFTLPTPASAPARPARAPRRTAAEPRFVEVAVEPVGPVGPVAPVASAAPVVDEPAPAHAHAPARSAVVG
ncbi:ATP-binding protein [Streptomyces sp. Ru71]|uniref:ATP-binding protein n=1 Tax=Streptomyces sp. Ru71 TaxID=2080746 RepID=UPI000CDD8F44|nr:ATP-binding protein [Streptomyces sp. Ru71]POX50425.1 ATP-binding protein [Streptomyces sp. Ru71]